jgi:KaiC/GvpD/RAD55 family RecA-like ATPase
LDDILYGGLTCGRVTLVLGEPGSGKTVLCSQFLLNGIEEFREKAMYVSLEESRDHYLYEMNAFGWDVESLEKTGEFSFIDASPIRAIPSQTRIGSISISKSDFSLVTLLEVIKNKVISNQVSRIVVDPISHLIFQYDDRSQRRKAMLDVVEALAKTGATCLLSSELSEVGGERRQLQIEEYLAHGVILLTTRDGRTRVIQVEKMRGSEIDSLPRPYRITGKGIEVYPTETVF